MKAEELLKIGKLFDALGWPTETDMTKQFPEVFERFCKMYERLPSAQQRQLIMELTARYQWIFASEHPRILLSTFDKLFSCLPEHIKTVRIAPLYPPRSVHPKSSDYVFKLVEAYLENLRVGARKCGKQIDLYKSACQAIDEHSDWVLVLVDDYIGSGGSALKALKNLTTPLGNSQVYVLALAAQNQAQAQLLSQGYSVISKNCLDKGISDHYPKPHEQLAVMEELEGYLDIGSDLRFGYGRTEALVTLTRTPNDTFPVYWTNRKVKGTVWDAPFVRETDHENRYRSSARSRNRRKKRGC